MCFCFYMNKYNKTNINQLAVENERKCILYPGSTVRSGTGTSQKVNV